MRTIEKRDISQKGGLTQVCLFILSDYLYPPVLIINEKLGDFFIDIAKLVFAGVVLSTLLDITSDKLLVLILGISATVVFVIVGLKYYKEKGGK